MVIERTKYKIKDIFELSAGGDVDREHFSVYKTNECCYPIYSNSLENSGLYGYTSNPKYKADSVTITGRGSVGHAEYRADKFDAIIRLLVLEPKDNNVCAQFVADYINNCVDFPLESTGVPQLTAPQIMNIELELPQYDEQKNIAALLSDINNLIDTLVKQIQKKKAIKQGAMQELLSGKTRINGFNSAWKQTTIREIATIFGRIGFRGYTKNDLVEPYKGAISLSPSNIVDGKLNLNNLTFISWEKYNESPEIMLEVGDVILVKTGSTFGKSTYIDNCKWKITLNPQIVVFKRIKVNSRLFGYIVQSKEFQNQIAATVVGGAIPTLSQEQIYNFEVNIPVDEMEQLAISSFLSDLDEEIEALEQKLAKYRQVKQGMMQQLLTGKIRLV